MKLNLENVIRHNIYVISRINFKICQVLVKYTQMRFKTKTQQNNQSYNPSMWVNIIHIIFHQSNKNIKEMINIESKKKLNHLQTQISDWDWCTAENQELKWLWKCLGLVALF